MNPDSPEFDDPQVSVDVLLLETRHQLSGEDGQRTDQCFSGRAQHHNAGCRFRCEAQDVAKVQIERDQASLFPPANVIYRFVGDTVKS